MSKKPRTPRDEQETLIRLGGEKAIIDTSSPIWERRWRKKGYPVEVTGRRQDKSPRRWGAEIPAGFIRLKRLPGHRRNEAWITAKLLELGLEEGTDCETPLEERETTIQWYEDEEVFRLCTTSPAQARHCVRKGYDLQVSHCSPGGRPWTWEATIPRKCFGFSKIRRKSRQPGPRLESGRFTSETSVKGPVLPGNSENATSTLSPRQEGDILGRDRE